MRWTGSGPEGIDPGNGLEHPARGPVGRKARVHFFGKGTKVGEHCWGELSRRLATRNVEVGLMWETHRAAHLARRGRFWYAPD